MKTGRRPLCEAVNISVECAADAEYLDLLGMAEHRVDLVRKFARAARAQEAWASLAPVVHALQKRLKLFLRQVVAGAVEKEELREELARTDSDLRALAERVASLPNAEGIRSLTETLWELVACSRLGEVLGGQASLPISCTFASGTLAPPIRVQSRLEVGPEWQHSVQGRHTVQGELPSGGLFTAQFLLTPPARFAVDQVVFRLHNTLRWNSLEFEYPTEFVFPATFLQAYYLIGPFDNFEGRGLDRADPPEREIDLGARYQTRFGQVHWQKWQWRPPRRSTGSVFINLRNTIWSGHDVAAYAVTDLESPRDMQVLFAVGSTGGYRLWVNGELIHVHRQQRPAEPGQDRLPVRLRAGRNRVLIKSAHTGGSWGFFLQVIDTRGRPIPGLVNTYVG